MAKGCSGSVAGVVCKMNAVVGPATLFDGTVTAHEPVRPLYQLVLVRTGLISSTASIVRRWVFVAVPVTR